MSRMKVSCDYCGLEELVDVWAGYNREKCSKCGDKNLKKEKIEPIDFYGKNRQPDAYIKPSNKD